jgi:hypothetical protein
MDSRHALERPRSEDRMSAIVRELAGNRCRCGKFKVSGHSFCGSCFLSLPPLTRKSLYRKLGHGYEEAYEEASKYLEAAGIPRFVEPESTPDSANTRRARTSILFARRESP